LPITGGIPGSGCRNARATRGALEGVGLELLDEVEVDEVLDELDDAGPVEPPQPATPIPTANSVAASALRAPRSCDTRAHSPRSPTIHQRR
jgi:hypothetical protein